MLDPLAAVFKGDDNSGQAAILPDNKQQNMLLSQMFREQILAKRQSEAASKAMLTDPAMNLSKAWERDQDYFLERMKDYAKTARLYYNSKGLTPAKKDEIQLQLLEKKGRLLNDINQSALDRTNFMKWNKQISDSPDDYDREDATGLKSFYDSSYEDRQHDYNVTKGSSVDVAKYLQSVKIPTYTKTVKVKDADGKFSEKEVKYIPAEQLKEFVDRFAMQDNKHMNVYKREYAQMHPGATLDDMKKDLAGALRLSNRGLKDVEVEYAAPAAKSSKVTLADDGSKLIAGDTEWAYEITRDGEAILTFNKTNTDADNKPLKFQKNVDKDGKATNEGVTGVPRGIIYKDGLDPYIQVMTTEPIMEKKFGFMQKVGTRDVTQYVPATIPNMRLISGNYKLDPAIAKKMLEQKAVQRWNARKQREGVSVNRPALTPEQRNAKGLSTNNTVGKKPIGL